MLHTGISEHIVQDVVGCGPFQMVMVATVCIFCNIPAVFSMMFMSFGNYNPGWRCLDANDTTTDNSSSSSSSSSSSPSSSYGHSGQVYIQDNCSLFESCNNVQFSPGTSTVVSEWGLLCGKASIPSVIISIQMAGVLVGGSTAGYLADAFGRKKTYFGAIGILFVLNVCTIFSSSWQMFAAFRFFMGIGVGFMGTLYFIYAVEFIPMKWRGPLACAPMWANTSIFFFLFCMLLRNWKYIHLLTGISALFALIPAFWVPESLRWNEAKNRTEEYEKTVGKMAKMNGKRMPPLNELLDVKSAEQDNDEKTEMYNVFHLFKGSYRKITLLNIIPWISVSLIFYALSFGMKALSGNFYVNLILPNVMEIPFSLLPMYAPNVIGRKKAGIFITSGCGAFLVAAAFLQDYGRGDVQSTGVLVCVTLGKLFASCYWGILMLHTAELYPTVIRGLGTSWGNAMARIGGVLAPFLIPNDRDSFFSCYVIMGVMATAVGVVITRLPETKGRQLQNNFETDTVTV